MKRLKNIHLLVLTCLIIVLTFSCGEDQIELSEIITLQLPENVNNVVGDGTSTIQIKAILDPNSDKTNRKIEFKTTDGSFTEADEKNPKEVVVTAEFNNEVLCAVVNWKVPAKKGNVFITAKPVLESDSEQFLVSKEIQVDTSIATSVLLTASEFSVYNNFDSEVLLTGLLKNNSGKGVTVGTKVKFEDIFEDSKLKNKGGRYRLESLTSNSSSKVSVVYSPGIVTPGQNILVLVTILNTDGSETNIKDTIKLYVKQKQ